MTLRLSSLVFACLLSPVSLASEPLPTDTGVGTPEPADVSDPLNHDEANAVDVRLLASARGWSYEDAFDFAEKQGRFRSVMTEISGTYANEFSSAINFEAPGATATVYFKGDAPAPALKLLRQYFDADEVEVMEHTGLNAAEWEALHNEIVTGLRNDGYSDFLVGFNSADMIEVVYSEREGPRPRLPLQAEGRVSMQAVAGHVNVDHSNGGVHGGGKGLRAGGTTHACTIGWCVETAGGTRGVVTAGHCSSLEDYENPYNQNLYNYSWQSQHAGTHGDFEWGTTAGPEWPNWWANEYFDLRRMDSVKHTWYRNDHTCLFGWSSGTRQCSQIYRTSYTAGSYGKQVLSVDRLSIPGDSGGGWSWATKAHGVNSGESWLNGAYRSRYSRTSRVDNALGVDLCVSP